MQRDKIIAWIYRAYAGEYAALRDSGCSLFHVTSYRAFVFPCR